MDLGWLSPIIGAAVGGIVYGAFVIWNRRGGDKSRQLPSWVELDNANRKTREELDTYRETTEKKIADLSSKLEGVLERERSRAEATSNILADAARQWPKDAPGPVFNADDLAALADTIPAKWRPQRPRPA